MSIPLSLPENLETRVKNWYRYCRAAHPGARLEAVTGRPLSLATVGKAASHAARRRFI